MILKWRLSGEDSVNGQRYGVSVVLGVVVSLAALGPPSAAMTAGSRAPVSSVMLTVPQRQQLLRLYAAYRGVPAADIAAGAPGSVLGARLLGDGAQWAVIRFEPSASAPVAVATGFQDGAGAGVFTRPAGGRWRILGLGGEPLGCAVRLPAPVRLLWRLTGCAAPFRSLAPRAGAPPSSAQVAVIAESQVGVLDNPAARNFTGLDCNPYTALEVPTAPAKGCGIDATFAINDRSGLWCADFVKWVWAQAGVTSDLALLTPAAASFYAWGRAHGEHMQADPVTPQVGDAVVFYPRGRRPNGHYADHVGLVTAVNPDGSVNLVDGDFLGPKNISVQADTGISSLSAWAAGIWGRGEQWVFVSPQLPSPVQTAAALTTPPG
jgi:CHAP domain